MSSQQPQEGVEQQLFSLTQPTEGEQQSLTSTASTPVTTSDSSSDEANVVIDQQVSNEDHEKDGDALKNDCSENKAFLDVQMVSSSQQQVGGDEVASGQQFVESLDDSSNNSMMEIGAADTSSMITNVTSSGSEMTENSTASMEEEETSSLVVTNAEVVPTPTDKCADTSLFETIESPNKRVRQDSNEQATEDDENTQEVSPSELEEPTAKKVKSNPNETSMISDTATDGSANTSSATIVCEEDDEIEVTLVYEDKERAITFYKTVFEVEIVDQAEETKPVEEGSANTDAAYQSDAQQPDDVKIKGFKLNAKLSPKKKVQALPRTPRIFVPSEKLQMTLDRVKGFEGACVEECLDFTCITCPEGNKLTLVKIDV